MSAVTLSSFKNEKEIGATGLCEAELGGELWIVRIMKNAIKVILLTAYLLFVGGRCQGAVTYPKAPEDGLQAVTRYLNASSLKFIGVSRIEDLTIPPPCQGYYIGTSNLAAGKLLCDIHLAPSGGWQYSLLRGTNGVGVIYTMVDTKAGKGLKCVQLDQVGPSEERLEALRIAEQLPAVKKQDYELRYFDLPWLSFSSLWLHGRSDDIFIPLPDSWGRWKGDQPYSEKGMIRILQPIAEQKIKEQLKYPPGTVLID